MPSGIGLTSRPETEITPLYSAIPSRLQPVALPVVAGSVPAPTLDGAGRPQPAYADSQVIYRDLVNEWGSFRLVVGGRDVTYFRDVPAQIATYQLQEPYGYGPADFAFPQLSSLEVDKWGAGDLAWFDIGKPVRLVQVDKDLHKVRIVWRGFITALNPTNDGTGVHCDGAASGRMTLRDRHPALFVFKKDIGRWIFNAFGECGIGLRPHLGPNTGITVDSRGRSGTYLSYVDGLLADSQDVNGDQWTIGVDSKARFVMQKKDRTTVAATIFNGAHGVEMDVTRDLSEEPTTFYGSGIDPDGQVWVNGRYPGLTQAAAPPFPGTMQLGDNDESVGYLTWKLLGMNYIIREDQGNQFTSNIQDAVKDLQDDANLLQTGVVDSATWDALYNTGKTGLSLRQAYQAPLAEDPEVRKWKRTGNGSIYGRNPRFKPSRIPVDRTVDHGAGVTKRRAKHWSQRQLNLVQTGKNWTGSITLTADALAGSVRFGDSGITPLSRLDIAAGDNVMVRNFDGDTLFHVSGVNVDGDLNVRLAVDTKARDLLTLGQIIERNRASRINPARQWLRQHRHTDANHAQIQWSEVGGTIFNKITCPADQWTVFEVLAGQAGTVDRLRTEVSNAVSQYVLAVTAKKTGPKYWQAKVGDPFATNADGSSKWTNAGIQHDIDQRRALLGVWGDASQPGGFYPGKHTDDTGKTTSDPVTGVLLDDGGFDYHTFSQPVLYVAIYPKTACELDPQRIMWPVLEAGT